MRIREEMPELGMVKTWLNGNSLSRDDILGKATLIHFWSVSCPTCKNQLKKINFLQHKYKYDMHVVGVHMARSRDDKDVQKVNNIIREYQIRYPVVVDNDDLITNAFGNRSVPSYYVFDENGVLRYYQTGASTMGLFERRIHRIVQEAK